LSERLNHEENRVISVVIKPMVRQHLNWPCGPSSWRIRLLYIWDIQINLVHASKYTESYFFLCMCLLGRTRGLLTWWLENFPTGVMPCRKP
ncbi:hypothetical protein NDU88_000853, partial [Pleurodeles waltl]